MVILVMWSDNPVWKKPEGALENVKHERVRQDSLTAMHYQANKEVKRLKEHADLLVQQAQEIMTRVELTEKIATAECGFRIVKLREYYLYDKEGILKLSLISPDEWDSPIGTCIATVRQLGDSTWEQVQQTKSQSLKKK